MTGTYHPPSSITGMNFNDPQYRAELDPNLQIFATQVTDKFNVAELCTLVQSNGRGTVQVQIEGRPSMGDHNFYAPIKGQILRRGFYTVEQSIHSLNVLDDLMHKDWFGLKHSKVLQSIPTTISATNQAAFYGALDSFESQILANAPSNIAVANDPTNKANPMDLNDETWHQLLSMVTKVNETTSDYAIVCSLEFYSQIGRKLKFLQNVTQTDIDDASYNKTGDVSGKLSRLSLIPINLQPDLYRGCATLPKQWKTNSDGTQSVFLIKTTDTSQSGKSVAAAASSVQMAKQAVEGSLDTNRLLVATSIGFGLANPTKTIIFKFKLS